ncbi:MAG: hypothetical protein Q9M31_09180 [Mariprofundus sp.]|nr:hypothetical protein [Mariprofundus sp.]
MPLEMLNAAKLTKLEKQWLEELDEVQTVNPARCLGAIARAKDIVSDADSDQYAYTYVGSDGMYAGIVLLSHACANSERAWLKMLELTLAPTFADHNNPPPLKSLFRIGGAVLTEVFSLSSDILKSDSVKIYGDSIMDARIWREIADPEKLPDDIELPFDVSAHGSWLVLKRK